MSSETPAIEFDATPDGTGLGRVKVDGRFYGLPANVIRQLAQLKREKEELREELIRAKAIKVCCGNFVDCRKPCAPRADALAEKCSKLGEYEKAVEMAGTTIRSLNTKVDALAEKVRKLKAAGKKMDRAIGGDADEMLAAVEEWRAIAALETKGE